MKKKIKKDYLQKNLNLENIQKAFKKKKNEKIKKKLIEDKSIQEKILFSKTEKKNEDQKEFLKKFYLKLKKIDEMENFNTIDLKNLLEIEDKILSEVDFINKNKPEIVIEQRIDFIKIIVEEKNILKVNDKIIQSQIFKIKLLDILKKIKPEKNNSDSATKKYIINLS